MCIVYDEEKYQYQLSIRQGGIITHVYISASFCLRDSDLVELKNTIDLQGINVLSDPDRADIYKQEHSQRVLITDRREPSLTQIEPQTFLLKGNLGQKTFVKNLHHIMYTISEGSRQIFKSECTIHAAAVSLPSSDRAILILGDKGSGKTITTYALCSYYDAELIGNDLVIIGSDKQGKQYLHGGTTNFTFRKYVMGKFFPDLLLEKNNASASISTGIDYESKIMLNPNQLNIPVCVDKKYIALVIRVNVHALAAANSVSKIFDKPTEALRLHENFARYIRGQTTPLVLEKDGTISGHFPSFDSIEMQAMRNKMVNSLLRSNFFYITAQSPQKATDLIMKTYNENLGRS